MKPRVLIIIDTGIIGGPGKGLFQFLNHVPTGAVEYAVCNFNYRTPRSTEFIEAARQKGIPLELLTQRFRFDPLPLREVAALVRDRGFNIIQSHGYKGHAIGWALSPMLGIPWVAFAHGWTTEDWKVRLYHKLDHFFLKRADRVVTVSSPLFDTVSRLRRGRIPPVMVPNAVDATELPGYCGRAELRNQLEVGPEEVLLGAFGRLSSEKGQRVLLEALTKLPESLRYRLVLVGDGPDRQALERFADEQGLADRVRFVGHQRSMRDYFEAIDLLVLPSLSEGLPNVVLEAMSLSKPVLATRVGAVPEVIEDGRTGWLVQPGDPIALSLKLASALSDTAALTSMGAAGAGSLYPRFCPKERAKRILGVYQEVLGAPPPAETPELVAA